MATKTKNFKLIKPSLNDAADITAMNTNWDIIDEELINITKIVPATSTDGVAYVATVPGVDELYNGLEIIIIPSVVSASTTPTLNVNGLGAKPIRVPLSFNNAAMTTPKLATYYTANRPLKLMFDSDYLTGGIWKVVDKQRTSAQDLYGTVPVEGGGTGAETAESARTNLGITNDMIRKITISTSTPSGGNSGDIWLVVS